MAKLQPRHHMAGTGGWADVIKRKGRNDGVMSRLLVLENNVQGGMAFGWFGHGMHGQGEAESVLLSASG